jgi:hypothetical protein
MLYFFIFNIYTYLINLLVWQNVISHHILEEKIHRALTVIATVYHLRFLFAPV